MTDDNSMDIDDVPRTPPRSIVRDVSPTSPSSLSLPRAQVDKFKTEMIEMSRVEDWPARLISAGDDKEKLQNVLISVLLGLKSEVAPPKGLIVPTGRSQATELVQSLNDSEVEELKNAVQSGDWVGLFTHRTCLSHFQ
jgi:hypothetical protein